MADENEPDIFLVAQDDADHGNPSSSQNFVIGEPSKSDFSVWESVLFSHNYCRKSSEKWIAICLTCEAENQVGKTVKNFQKKRTEFKCTGGNTKGLLFSGDHISVTAAIYRYHEKNVYF